MSLLLQVVTVQLNSRLQIALTIHGSLAVQHGVGQEILPGVEPHRMLKPGMLG